MIGCGFDLAFDHLIDDVVQTRLAREQILAELQLVPRLGEHRTQDEGHRMLDDAFLEQQVRDFANALSRRDVDDLILGERPRGVETLLGDSKDDAANRARPGSAP